MDLSHKCAYATGRFPARRQAIKPAGQSQIDPRRAGDILDPTSAYALHYRLHQRQNRGLFRPLIPLEECGLKLTVSVSWHLQFDCMGPGGQLSLVGAVPVPPSIVGLLARCGLQMFGHLGLQNLVLWSAPAGPLFPGRPGAAGGSSRRRSRSQW